MAEKPVLTKDIRQDIASKIGDSESILITVNNDPTVDELATALALTLVLDAMGKHATAIASGKIPDALEFLGPEKTFEDNVDSLRDFIIALNKEKADHLRYKIEGDFVKVFITPYRTTISEDDLDFSRGDYNVNLVISLNVKSNDSLDKALQAHGKILHDATVINITTGPHEGIGNITWVNENASSLAEMVEDLISVLKIEDDQDPLIDQAVATALLTGIVSATDRFSNERTSATTMGAASKLMKYGADQQLVVSNLDKFKDAFSDDLGSEADVKKKIPKKSKKSADELAVNHGEGEDAEPEAESEQAEAATPETAAEAEATMLAGMAPSVDLTAQRQEEAARLVEQRLAEGLAAVGTGQPAALDALDDLRTETDRMAQESAAVPELPAAPTAEMVAPDYSAPVPVEAAAVEPPALQGAVSNWQRHILPSDPVGGVAATMEEEPSVPSIEDSVGIPQPEVASTADATPSMFGSALSPEQLANLPGPEPVAQPAAPEYAPAPEPAPAPVPEQPVPVDMSASAFVPPVPPPPVPEVSLDGVPPMPPGVPEIAVPEPIAPEPVAQPAVQEYAPTESVLPPEPALPNTVPEGSVFENNTQVMPDQIYPPAAQNDVGQYRIPGQ